jgi:hypothetical protein
MMFGHPVRQNGNEDQIVDAQHDLHHDQGEKGCPGGGIGGESEERGHGVLVIRMIRFHIGNDQAHARLGTQTVASKPRKLLRAARPLVVVPFNLCACQPVVNLTGMTSTEMAGFVGQRPATPAIWVIGGCPPLVREPTGNIP